MEITRKKIGIFDSGVGGFSILQELINVLHGHEFFYISDRPNSPYGSKTKDFISARCVELTKVLLEQGVDIILIACNTATAVCIDELREQFDIPFVGVEPFVKAIENFNFTDKKVHPVVLTTKAMHDSERFKLLLTKYDPDSRIAGHPCPGLASLIERCYIEGFKELEREIEAELATLLGKGYSHAILGCTHYPLISKKISDYLDIECISPCLPVAKRVAHLLGEGPLEAESIVNFKISNEESFYCVERTLLSLQE